MARLASEPIGTVNSMAQLFAIASAMEQAAIDGYAKLAERMRAENRLDLVEVFDRLIAEERRHLASVNLWSRAVTGEPPDRNLAGWDPQASFDDEGADVIAPELLSAYRAFSIAVRNEERAFSFWSYLAAQTSSEELRVAAEQMASEELEHVATLRRERRRAFHAQRSTSAATESRWTFAALERRLARLLTIAAKTSGADGLAACAIEANERADALGHAPMESSSLLARVPNAATERAAPCAELLLEGYLDLSERLDSQDDRDRAQTFAARLLQCLSAIRDVAERQ